VQVHDQQVQAVAGLALAVGEGDQVAGVQRFLLFEPFQKRQPLLAALTQRGLGRAAGLADRLGHGLQIVANGLRQGIELRQHQQRILHKGVGGEFAQPEQVGLAVLAQLGAPVGQRGLRVGRVRRRRLQHRQIQLEAVVGQQGGGDPGRQEQRILAQRGDGFLFVHGANLGGSAQFALGVCQAREALALHRRPRRRRRAGSSHVVQAGIDVDHVAGDARGRAADQKRHRAPDFGDVHQPPPGGARHRHLDQLVEVRDAR